MNQSIIIKGARHNNLKNISLEIPRNKLVVFTGVSGSGKSSLVFDTIYMEGRKRLLDCFSPFERHYLGNIKESDVDSIEGLSAVVAVEQKKCIRNPRSTVGTMTSIYDYMRLLFSRAGDAICPYCGEPLPVCSKKQIIDSICTLPEKTGIELSALIYEAAEEGSPIKVCYRRATVASIEVSQNQYKAITAAIIKAMEIGNGLLHITANGHPMPGLGCRKCGLVVHELPAGAFSFNSPFGACATCTGIGVFHRIDPDLILPDRSKSISEGAINLLGWKCRKDKFAGNRAILESLAGHYRFSLDTPLCELPEEVIRVLLSGTEKKIKMKQYMEGVKERYQKFEGLINHVKRVNALRKASMEQMFELEESDLTTSCICPECAGSRLKRNRLSYRARGKTIQDLCEMTIYDLMDIFRETAPVGGKEEAGNRIVKEIIYRLQLLIDMGVGYLSLARESGTLSGGEAQRLRLMTILDSGLVDMIYILDEPTIGLHSKDTENITAILKKLRDKGNTVMVVEHDEDIMRQADLIVDIGPGSGINGGRIVACGTADDLARNEQSLTGFYLSGKSDVPCIRRKNGTFDSCIEVIGARANNLKGISVKIPLHCMVAVTGVSGSGKSTLVNEVLYNGLAGLFLDSSIQAGEHDEIKGAEGIRGIVKIDQMPIGRSPRSNPATYIEVYDQIRKLFSDTPKARERKYKPSRFSFNEIEGRCEACAGLGTITTQMHFMPDIEVKCEICGGKRFNDDTLEILYRDKTIAEVLDMSVAEAIRYFQDHPDIHKPLSVLDGLGLGYMKLGQPATTLSGGEAQRLKLAYELCNRKDRSNYLYVLDEPTTGLHTNDTAKLIKVLRQLVDAGNSVIVIEHNLNLIRTADYIIDLGPEGGSRGGEIIAIGTPENVMSTESSYTGKYLKKMDRLAT